MWKKTKFENIFVTEFGKVAKKNGDTFHELPIYYHKNNQCVYLKNPDLNSKNKNIRYRVNRLILETFKGNPDNLNNVLHLNQNKDDNSLSNLIWSNASCRVGTQKPYSKEHLRKVREEKECFLCKNMFKVKPNRKKFCSLLCSRRNASKYAGLASAAARQTRGKNEIHFAKLCIEYFGEDKVLCNQPIFNGWDADVIIPHLKIAVLWNGVHHYKTVYKEQSLSQVQNRDKIKLDQIAKHGYTAYTIKDMGKVKPEFVKQEFMKFLEYLKTIT